MKFTAFVLAALIALTSFSFAPSASAQQDIGGIIDEIFKGQRRAPDQRFPDRRQNEQSSIDNIPVEVRFDVDSRGLPAESMLIVSAYAPPPPNVRRSSPLMIGETRLLLSGLESPVNLVIAAPSKITSEIDHARIEAKIVDHNGNLVFELKNSGEYRGYDAPVLRLTRFGETATPPRDPNDFSSETVRGTVRINGVAPQFTGSVLNVRLIEDGLAGGTSRVIVGETRQVLDRKTAPFEFELTRAINPNTANTPLAFEVWIEDWAGRKTHVTPSPITFNGSATHYRFSLDEISSTPISGQTYPTPPTQTPAMRPINGTAKFDAFKGLPSGSILTAELERVYTSGRPTQIATTRVSLDGLSGDVPFIIDAPETAFDPRLPAPVLRVRIEDKDGKLFFSNPGGTVMTQGANTIDLRAAAGY